MPATFGARGFTDRGDSTGKMPAVGTHPRPMKRDGMQPIRCHAANPLSAHEWEEIRAAIERSESAWVISDRLERHRLKIDAEINRNRGRWVSGGDDLAEPSGLRR